MVKMLSCMIPLLVVAVGAGPEGVAVKDVVSGNNHFAVDLFGQARARAGNLFFSPYSISSALAMTYAGAVGETARQMAATLRFPVMGGSLHESFARIDAGVDGGKETKPYQLSTANALWGQQGLTYRPEFLKLTETCYRAGLHPVDFASDPETARRLINTWVQDRTRDKVRDLIPASSISKSTDLVLTNALYFKGAWTTPFPKSATRDEEFTTDQGRILAPTMHQMGQFGYLEGDGFQALDLPYAGGSLSMVVLLPKKVDGLADFEASWTAPKLEGWLAKLSPKRVEVWLPRFQLECGLDLAATLKSLGMTLAFGPDADFSGMTSDRRLFLSAVIHKAFADVNEEGTEAAAATAVVITRMNVVAKPITPIAFKADHPFLFLIRDARSGSILFLGRVANPKG